MASTVVLLGAVDGREADGTGYRRSSSLVVVEDVCIECGMWYVCREKKVRRRRRWLRR
jgi:formylmethanofuran dehydrogenase subunit B